ncbi:MAG TPA: hypothetical protein VNM89_03715 [Solirubrobacterales bacterium]|nr:hypothetical protein [Solirubrobacterales bacterium]
MAGETTRRSRPLVQWVNHTTAPLGRDLPDGSPIGAIAASVLAAPAIEKTIIAANEAGLGVVFDPEAWLTQLDPEHPRRRGRFKHSDLNWLPRGVFDPERAVLSEADVNDLAARHRDAEVRAGATMPLSPVHRVQDSFTLGRGRRLDLDLAHEFCRLVRITGATHPTPGAGLPRRVAAGLAVDARDLHSSPRAHTNLVAAYSEVDADIFWIWVWNFEPSARQYQLVRFLARALQRKSGKLCLLAGIRGLWEAALRNQVGAALQGWGRGRLEFPPFEPPQPSIFDEEEDEDPGWAVHIFHPVIRGAIPLGEAGEEIARFLFRRYPCDCGHHPRHQPPVGVRERHFHNRYCADQLGRAAIAGEPAGTTAELREVVALAASTREEVGMGRLHTAWSAAAKDPSDGSRIVVPADLWRVA